MLTYAAHISHAQGAQRHPEALPTPFRGRLLLPQMPEKLLVRVPNTSSSDEC